MDRTADRTGHLSAIMDPLCRVIIAAVNERRPSVAMSLLGGRDESPAVETVEELVIVLERLCGATVHRDYAAGGPPTLSLGERMPHADDLDLDELAFGVRLLAAQRDDLEITVIDRVQSVAREATSVTARDRCRLLFEDYLFQPTRRSVASDRMTRLAAIDRRDQRDVETMFEELPEE